MNIDINNYEIFFIDYHDGNLTAEQTAELFLFLESHSELQEAFNSFSDIKLEIPEVKFPYRDSLKKGEINSANVDHHLIAALEGDSTVEEKNALEKFVKSNPSYNKDREIYKATISVPDFSIVYPDKKSLKKPLPFFVAYRNEIRYGIAAILLLAFIAGTVIVFNRTMDKKVIQVAEETPAVSPLEVPPAANKKSKQTPGNETHFPAENLIPDSKVLTADKTNPVLKSSGPQAVTPKNPVAPANETTVQLAEAVPSQPLPSNQDSASVVTKSDPLKATNEQIVSNSGEKYMTVWEAIRQTSEKSLKKFVADDEAVLAYADDAAESKPTLVAVVSKGIEKVSNEKIKLDTDKENRRFSFSAGNFKIERR
ncbi:MAG: hypothetical protein M3Q95_03560 [Bacteroidota bacterium]|nr:hypothetical protein [Bacteroidota bacterium]